MHNCGQQEDPASVISKLLLCMPGTYKARFAWTSTKNKWNAQGANWTRSCVFWPSIAWTLRKAKRWCKEGCKRVLTFDRCRPHSVTFGYYHIKYVGICNSRTFFKTIILFPWNIDKRGNRDFPGWCEFQHWSTRTTFAVWHNHITPAVAALDNCFVLLLIRTHRHGIAPGNRSLLPLSTPPFTAEASAKALR